MLIVGDLFLDVVGRIRRDELSVEFKALVEVTPGLLVVAVVDKSEENIFCFGETPDLLQSRPKHIHCLNPISL